jgi:hypothetical protein
MLLRTASKQYNYECVILPEMSVVQNLATVRDQPTRTLFIISLLIHIQSVAISDVRALYYQRLTRD